MNKCLSYSSGGKRTCMPPLATRTDSPGETPEVPQDPCRHGRGILRFQHRLRNGLMPRNRRVRNPGRPPSNSHGDWPFLRPPERVPDVPVVCREHLLQLKKFPDIPVSTREEAREFRQYPEETRFRLLVRDPAVALRFPLTELSLLEPLAVCNPPAPKPSSRTLGT